MTRLIWRFQLSLTKTVWRDFLAEKSVGERASHLAQRGGYGGYYIPEDRFRVSFGSQHWFRIHSRPTLFYDDGNYLYNRRYPGRAIAGIVMV